MDQRREHAQAFLFQAFSPEWTGSYVLTRHGIDVHHAFLQQMQRQHRQLLPFQLIEGHFAARSIEDGGIGTAPVHPSQRRLPGAMRIPTSKWREELQPSHAAKAERHRRIPAFGLRQCAFLRTHPPKTGFHPGFS
jgi:hypothetical protein